jgi:transposase
VIELRAGTKIWIAAGVTDMRRGFQGLSAQVQTVLQQQPFSGHVFLFRGRRGDIVKCLWFDGIGFVFCPSGLSAAVSYGRRPRMVRSV